MPGARLTLDAGSVIRALGTVVDPGTHTVIIGNDAAKIAGNGSLLAISNGATLDVQRQRVAQATAP